MTVIPCYPRGRGWGGFQIAATCMRVGWIWVSFPLCHRETEREWETCRTTRDHNQIRKIKCCNWRGAQSLFKELKLKENVCVTTRRCLSSLVVSFFPGLVFFRATSPYCSTARAARLTPRPQPCARACARTHVYVRVSVCVGRVFILHLSLFSSLCSTCFKVFQSIWGENRRP